MKGTNFECACGRKWRIEPDTVRFQSSVPSPLYPTASPPMPTATPKTSGVTERDVTVPLLLSAITGVLVALLMLIAEAKLRWALGGGLCFTTVTWAAALLLFFLSRAGLIQALIWAIEDRLGVDIDGDDQAGEPEQPGRITINAPPRRARKWVKLKAADRLEDLVAFARRAYELQDAGRGSGQKEFRAFGLPSRFKCADHIHAALVCDLVDAGLAHYAPGGFEFKGEIDTVHRLEHEIRQRVTAQ